MTFREESEVKHFMPNGQRSISENVVVILCRIQDTIKSSVVKRHIVIDQRALFG